MKEILLIIDDGPSPDTLQKLDFLKEQKITAIFFCVGRELKLREKETQELVNSEHIIANHGFNHTMFSNLNQQATVNEILDTQDYIDSLHSSDQLPLRYFRFPFGDSCLPKVKIPGLPFRFYKKHHELQLFLKTNNFNPLPNRFSQQTITPKLLKSKRMDWTLNFDFKEWELHYQHLSERESEAWISDKINLFLKNTKPEVTMLHDHTDNFDVFKSIILKLKKNCSFIHPNSI